MIYIEEPEYHTPENHYPALGLDFKKILFMSNDDARGVIKEKFRTLLKELHPDHNGGNVPDPKKLNAVIEANKVLGNSEKRTEHDIHLAGYVNEGPWYQLTLFNNYNILQANEINPETNAPWTQNDLDPRHILKRKILAQRKAEAKKNATLKAGAGVITFPDISTEERSPRQSEIDKLVEAIKNRRDGIYPDATDNNGFMAQFQRIPSNLKHAAAATVICVTAVTAGFLLTAQMLDKSFSKNRAVSLKDNFVAALPLGEKQTSKAVNIWAINRTNKTNMQRRYEEPKPTVKVVEAHPVCEEDCPGDADHHAHQESELKNLRLSASWETVTTDYRPPLVVGVFNSDPFNSLMRISFAAERYGGTLITREHPKGVIIAVDGLNRTQACDFMAKEGRKLKLKTPYWSKPNSSHLGYVEALECTGKNV